MGFDANRQAEIELDRALDREYDSWEDERPCRHDIDVPDWINQDITPYDLEAIVQGGCASGAYMPAVTYYDARQTMAQYGDEVLDYIQDCGDLPDVSGQSWSGMACLFLSTAVEIWASIALDEVTKIRERECEEY